MIIALLDVYSVGLSCDGFEAAPALSAIFKNGKKPDLVRMTLPPIPSNRLVQLTVNIVP